MSVRREVVAVLLAGSLLAAPAWAGWCPLSKRACGVEGLQSSVVEGIIMVESGGNPWALHVGIGKGYAFYPRNQAEARRYLAVSLALTDNVDIGLMQVNWRTWGEGRWQPWPCSLRPARSADKPVDGLPHPGRSPVRARFLRGAFGALSLAASGARALVCAAGPGRGA